jgi:hypothetical protein
LQLRSFIVSSALALGVAAGATGEARAAEVEASQRFTLFLEPSNISGNAGITVFHPQTDVSATFGSGAGISVGYAVDAVSGATPRVFAVRNDSNGRPVDAISGATKFSDLRQQVHGGLSYSRPTGDISGSYSYGWEKDYRSNAVTVTTRTDVFDHVFSIGLSYTHNFDRVCDASNIDTLGIPLARQALANSSHCFQGTADVATRKLNIDAIEPSVTWALTPRLALQGGGTVLILDGFQSNPYRQVDLGKAGARPQETLPQLRQRYALFVRGAYALPRLRASIQAMGRAYRDTWGVEALTGEVTLHQYITRYLLWSARARAHSQRGAVFYEDAQEYFLHGPNGKYWTGDRELSPMQNFLVGGKLAYLRVPESGQHSFFSEIEAALKWEALLYHLDSTYAPNADRKLATIWQASISARF